MAEGASVAAIIPQWNRADLLRTALESCARQTRRFDEVIVVDGASTDLSVEVAERAGARVVKLDRNYGFAAAVNRGVESARTKWVAILNNDVTLAEDWAERIVCAAEREGAWFATGKIVRADNPEIIDATFDEVSRGACAWRCGAGRRDGEVWNRARKIRMAPLTACVVRRELFEEVGGLEESFESYMEDVEFGLRCAIAGREGVYVPEAVARHVGSATLGEWNKDTVWRIARNQVLLAAKHFGGESRWPILVGQLLWGGVAIRHGCGIAYLRGKVSGLRFARRWRSGEKKSQEKSLRSVLEASERNIFELQQQTGFDGYWRAYFWLLRR